MCEASDTSISGVVSLGNACECRHLNLALTAATALLLLLLALEVCFMRSCPEPGDLYIRGTSDASDATEASKMPEIVDHKMCILRFSVRSFA